MLVASLASGDYAFLSLKYSPFDLTDRGVAGRDAPAGLDAYVFTERGVYRTGETVHVTALLRDAESIAVTGVPLTLVVTRSDGVEYRRNVVPDQGIGGRSLDVPIISSAPTGTWRVAAFTDPKRPAIGEATFLVEDYVADRLEFDLTTTATSISPTTPAKIERRWALPLWRAGLGAHARRRDQHRQGDGAAGLCRLCVRPRRRQRRRPGRGVRHHPPRRPAGDRQRRQSEFHRGARQGAGLDAAAASRDRGAHGGGRRPRGRAQAHASRHAVRADDRGEAAVQRQVARRFRHGELRRGHGRA